MISGDWMKRWRSWCRQRHGTQALIDVMPAIERWLKTDLGQAVLAEEITLIEERVLPLCRGVHLMQLSAARDLKLCSNAPVNHPFCLAPSLALGTDNLSIVGQLDALPIASESVDMVLLHHVLAYSSKPHRVLREVSRAVSPGGYLVIMGVNPWSLLGLAQRCAKWVGRVDYCRAHSLRVSRMRDWLRLLGYELVDQQSYFYGVPLQKTWARCLSQPLDWLGQRWRLGFGGGYCIVARKRVHSGTPLKSNWKVSPISSLVPSPSTGKHSHKQDHKHSAESESE